MFILGIETSCDETAIALIETRPGPNNGSTLAGTSTMRECRIIGSLIHSQADLHSPYGGVYPTLAKREHGKNLIPLLEKLLEKTSADRSISTKGSLAEDAWRQKIEKFSKSIAPQNPELFETLSNAKLIRHIPAIDAIAVTEGPGLEPALWVGITFAQALSELWNIPVIPVNHMEGHIIGSLINFDMDSSRWQKITDLDFPSLAFLISGGHTEFVQIDPGFKYSIIGSTRDDAVGEAFDKVARLLGLPYPGGPQISNLAAQARSMKLTSPISLPRPMINSNDLHMSFSGLKTAVLYAIRKITKDGERTMSNEEKLGLAMEFEDSVIEVLDAKLRKAIDFTQTRTIIVGGGVSANKKIRESFEKTASEYGIKILLPHSHVSGDNALMIALAGSIHPISSEKIRADGTKSL